jgi:D-alanyl-D-alanine carboxypeptidase (penicillin-binding protein 5/6)
VAAAAPPHVEARAWYVVHAESGEVLAAHAQRERMPIASITKLMTVLVVLDRFDVTDVVHVDARAVGTDGERIFLRPGEPLTIGELVKAALIQSANNAAAALALATAQDFAAFAELMNAKARALGLEESHFVRPDGLDTGSEYSSARDATRLARAAMDVPFVRRTVAQSTATIAGGRTLYTWNDLLGFFPGAFGVKTGHTDAAGWSQVASARGDGGTVYATILGSPSREQRNGDLQALLAWGLSQYRVVEAVKTGRTYAQARLPYDSGVLTLVAARPLRIVVRPGRPLLETVVAPIAVALPVRQGEVLGHVEIRLGKRVLGRRPLVSSRSVSAPGATARLGWYAERTVRNVAGILTP